MCGIAGVFDPARILGPETAGILGAMSEVMAHRGPDDQGQYLDGHCGMAFRRLAVIDLQSGHQPMQGPARQVTIVFNGEVYNFPDLRRELENHGVLFQTNSDTEVIAAGYENWGPEIVHKLRGMFAFAIHDPGKNRIFLARDHTGIKPLYYCESGSAFLFASEIKALLRFPGIIARANIKALPSYMSFLWVPAPETLFEGIFMLEPGHTLEVSEKGLVKTRYWNPDLRQTDDHLTEAEWREIIRHELQRAVREQLISDVPLGALLSGGVDSSLIVALMNQVDPQPVTTYTTGFLEADLERDVIRSDLLHARMAARHLVVDYREIILNPDVVRLLPKLVWHMDEPVADPAAINTFLICQAAKEQCTVMLSGVGGDEIFGGYPRYWAALVAERYNTIPRILRRWLVESWINGIPSGQKSLFRNAKKFIKSSNLPFKKRYFGFLTYYSQDELRKLLRRDFDFEGIFQHHDRIFEESRSPDLLQSMMNLDLKTFLPNLNLMYTDKMSSAAAVEIRVPFLDHRFIEKVSTIPGRLKIHRGTRKYILKQVAEEFLPPEIVWRKKVGFGAPVGAWLKGQVREMMLDLLSEETLKRRGYFHPIAVRRLIDDHLKGMEYNANQLWQLITLELWHQTYIKG